jgi:hypothetical protein
MNSTSASVEAVSAIVFGLLQLAIGIISLRQQLQLRRAYRKCCINLKHMPVLTNWKTKGVMDEDIRSESPGVAMIHECSRRTQKVRPNTSPDNLVSL